MKTVCALDFDEMTLTTRYQSSIKRFSLFFFFLAFFFHLVIVNRVHFG